MCRPCQVFDQQGVAVAGLAVRALTLSGVSCWSVFDKRTYRVDPEHEELHGKFIKRLEEEQWRMDYPAYRARGLQIGSGAMESIHRNGSQLRLKLPGARWLVKTAQAVMNLRMLEIAGRWDDFWAQDGIVGVLVEAFTPPAATALLAA